MLCMFSIAIMSMLLFYNQNSGECDMTRLFYTKVDIAFEIEATCLIFLASNLRKYLDAFFAKLSERTMVLILQHI